MEAPDRTLFRAVCDSRHFTSRYKIHVRKKIHRGACVTCNTGNHCFESIARRSDDDPHAFFRHNIFVSPVYLCIHQFSIANVESYYSFVLDLYRSIPIDTMYRDVEIFYEKYLTRALLEFETIFEHRDTMRRE